jgi:hypothetical protein
LDSLTPPHPTKETKLRLRDEEELGGRKKRKNVEAPPIQCIPGALSPGVKGPGRETDYLSPSSADVKNGCAISPLPQTCSWRDGYLIKHRDNFTHLPASNVADLPKLCLSATVLFFSWGETESNWYCGHCLAYCTNHR